MLMLEAIEVTSACSIGLAADAAAVLLLYAKLDIGGNDRQEAFSSTLAVKSPSAATASSSISSCLSCSHMQDDDLEVAAKLSILATLTCEISQSRGDNIERAVQDMASGSLSRFSTLAAHLAVHDPSTVNLIIMKCMPTIFWCFT